jgi:lipoprotein-anchoring transpeptidase ErfK/SrfK
MKTKKWIAAAAMLLSAGTAEAQGPALDREVMQVQVVLDRLGFSPGAVDGKRGQSLVRALRGFQMAQGLKMNGTLDEATRRVLDAYKAVPGTVTVPIGPNDVAGPFVNPTPKDAAEQAKLSCLCYRTILEKLSERYHTTPATLIALNSPDTPLKAGQPIVVPAIFPETRDYAAINDEAWRATLSSLNVGPKQPQADRIVVDKSEGVLRAFAGDKLIAQFPATMGSAHDPLPIGKWTIKGAAYNPTFHYNPDLFWDAKSTDEKQKLPAGPNGPVGVIWIDLSKDHYGIHGTPEPEKIGRTESHGCIRLTNWDAARLSLMVKPGTPAIFQE